MLEDLEFIIGNKEKLSGQCIIYTTNMSGSENPFNPRHPALAVASDPADLAEILSTITDFSDDMRRMLNAKIKESAELWSRTMFGQRMYQTVQDLMSQGLAHLKLPDEYKKQIEEELKSIPNEKTGVAHHGFFVPLVGFDPEVIEPYRDSVDLAKTPEVPNISFAGLVLSGHAQHYLAMYLQQKERPGDKPAQEDSGKTEEPEFSRDGFLDNLKSKISAIMYAMETGSETETLLKDLVSMTSGTVYMRDALSLSRVARSDHAMKLRIIELYLKRIRLLYEEKYEEIPAIDSALKLLDKPSA